jgi:tRNA pseudouridine13 synthase
MKAANVDTPQCAYLTHDIPAIPLRFKVHTDDFIVEELPQYEPCGEGEHLYVRVRKRGMSTMQLVRELRRQLGIPAHAIGVAGLKDAKALTTQTVSISKGREADLATLHLDGMEILEVSRHRNKLRTGHLRGNHFRLKLRDVPHERLPEVQRVLDVLRRRGLPNYFGPQRFGMRQDTWEIGLALLRDDFTWAARLIAGLPRPDDPERSRLARELFEQQEYARAATMWPPHLHDNSLLCRLMAKHRGRAKPALLGMPSNLLWFYLTALQAWLFNRYLAQRIQAIDRLYAGDLAYKHDNGAVFRVHSVEDEAPRLSRFEISPSGPLFGYKMTLPAGQVQAMEQQILRDFDLRLEQFRKPGKLKCQGGRRSLRLPLRDVHLAYEQDQDGPYVSLAFTLPAGGYATAVLRELGKELLVDAGRA